MLTTYFISNARRKNLLLSFRTVSFVRIFILNIGLWMIGACGQLDAVGQGRINNTPRQIDTAVKVTISAINLRTKQKDDAAKYRDFLINKNFNDSSLPYYPYVLINLEYLLAAPIRVYLGKQTIGNKNDYMFLVVRCKRYKGIPPKGQIITYTDDSTSQDNSKSIQPRGADKKKNDNWSSIRFSRNSSTNDSVFYRGVTIDSARQYIKNFKSIIKAKGLEKRYPRCFVIERKKYNKDNQNLLLLQPVVRSRKTFPRSSSGSGRNRKRPVPQDDKIIEFTGQDVCCYSPPEGGTSIDQ